MGLLPPTQVLMPPVADRRQIEVEAWRDPTWCGMRWDEVC